MTRSFSSNTYCYAQRIRLPCTERFHLVHGRSAPPPPPRKAQCKPHGLSHQRAAKLQFEVLRNFEVCRADDDAMPSKSNPSRIPLGKALQHEDGAMLSTDEYNHILATAQKSLALIEKLPRPAKHGETSSWVGLVDRTMFSRVGLSTIDIEANWNSWI